MILFVHKANINLQNGVKNAITLFHQPNNSASTRVLTLLKQANATSTTTATEDQASSHHSHSSAQMDEFELEVTEQAPTSDQLRSILEFVGDGSEGKVIEGAVDAADAQRRLRQSLDALKRPLTVAWNDGKVVVGDNESELMKMIKAQGQQK